MHLSFYGHQVGITESRSLAESFSLESQTQAEGCCFEDSLRASS
jgi:hypothetical protein